MAKENSVPVEYHLKFNERNPRHVKAALALASVSRRYKSSFIALAIECYMQTHPLGISQTELLDITQLASLIFHAQQKTASQRNNGEAITL